MVERLGVDPLFHHVLLAPLPGEPEDRHDVVVAQLAGQLNPLLDGRALLGIVGALIGPEPEGDDRAAPLVAHLAGGPGGALADLLDYFVLAGDESPHASPPRLREPEVAPPRTGVRSCPLFTAKDVLVSKTPRCDSRRRPGALGQEACRSAREKVTLVGGPGGPIG